MSAAHIIERCTNVLFTYLLTVSVRCWMCIRTRVFCRIFIFCNFVSQWWWSLHCCCSATAGNNDNKNSSGDEIANVNFYAVCPEAARIRWNNAITPFKVTDFVTNQKRIYGFLLVINTNLPPILQRFRDIDVDRSKIAILAYPSCV